MRILLFEHSFFCFPSLLVPFSSTTLLNSSFRPFDSGFFVVQARNPQEQFYYLRCLMEWLCELAGAPFPNKGSIDDDITASASVMASQLRKLGCSSDISPTSLKTAHGEAVCNALNFLCDYVFKKQHYSVGSPEFLEDGAQDNLVEEVNGDDDDEEIGDDEIVEDDDEGNAGGIPSAGADDFGLDDTVQSTVKRGGKDAAPEKKGPRGNFGFGFDDEDEDDDDDDDQPLDRRQKKGKGRFGLDLGDDEFGKKKTTQADHIQQTQEPRYVQLNVTHPLMLSLVLSLFPSRSLPFLFSPLQSRLRTSLPFRCHPVAF